MKRGYIPIYVMQAILVVLAIGCMGSTLSANSEADLNFIAGHEVARESVLRSIPIEYIHKARTTLHIAYQHTSHGTHVTRGLAGLNDYKDGDSQLFGFSYVDDAFGKGEPAPIPGKLDLRDHALAKYSPDDTQHHWIIIEQPGHHCIDQ